VTSDDDRIAYLAGEHDGELVDDADRHDLDEIRALLADPALWAEPPGGLEDAIVAAIGEQAAGTPAAAAPPARPRRRRRRAAVWLGAAAAAIAVAAAAAVLVGGDGDQSPTFAATLTPTELSPGAHGDATFTRTTGGWRIELDATGLPRLDGGRFYQAWLRNDAGVLVPIGTFNEPDDVVLWAGVSPAEFPTITVTQEAADGDQSSSGQRVLTGAINER